MKNILITLLLIFVLFQTGFAQKKMKFEEAKELYSRLAYSEAITLLSDYLKSADNIEAKQLLAQCYVHTNNYEQAENTLAAIVNDSRNTNNTYILCYAKTLQTLGRYNEAADWYTKYLSQNPNSSFAKNQEFACKNKTTYFGDSLLFLSEHLPFNTDGLDFGACIRKDVFIYTSTGGKTNSKNKNIDLYTDEPFMDIYEVKFDDTALNFSTAQIFNAGINTKYHEGPLAFSPLGKEVYFTRNDYNPYKSVKKVGCDNDKIINLKIFKAYLENGKWVKDEELSFNSSEYSCGHPTVDFKKQIMYFTSDMPGGYGGTDLWYSKFNGTRWLEPINAGSKINTDGNEMFPYLAADGILYFSSNGQAGLGGLDIFAATLKNNEVVEVKNLNSPINSSYDDFAFLLRDNGRVGFYSSNRPGGNGNDDIYLIYKNSFNLEGTVIDSRTNLPLANAEVKMSSNNQQLHSFKTDKNGNFKTEVRGLMTYDFWADASNYIPNTNQISIPATKQDQTYKITIPLQPIVAEITYFDKLTKLPIANAHSDVTTCQEVQTSISSADNGKAYMDVLENCKYKLLSNAKGYFPEQSAFEIGELQDTFRTVVELKPINYDIMTLNNIYYDFDKCYIRPDAVPDLSMLLSFIKANPDAQVELSSHTDARGDDDYNMKLSQCRADAAVEWLNNHGVSKAQITAVGYGESKLLNMCANDISCTEEEHQKNRRTEFRVTNAGVITSSQKKDNIYTDRCKNCKF